MRSDYSGAQVTALVALRYDEGSPFNCEGVSIPGYAYSHSA